jgi:hypothetical protein
MAYNVKKDYFLGSDRYFIFFMNIKHLILREGMVGDTGFEPVTSTVCKRHKKRAGRRL